jgi:hypothetical protein
MSSFRKNRGYDVTVNLLHLLYALGFREVSEGQELEYIDVLIPAFLEKDY